MAMSARECMYVNVVIYVKQRTTGIKDYVQTLCLTRTRYLEVCLDLFLHFYVLTMDLIFAWPLCM